MAQVFVSPGVFTQENDLSFVPAGIAAIGAATIGLSQKGPAFEPVEVNTFADFRSKFGNLDPDYYMPYAAKEYLQHNNILNVVRVLSTQTSTSVGVPAILAWGNSTSDTTLTATATAMAVLRERNGATLTSCNITGTSDNFILEVNGTTAGNLSMNRSSANYLGKVLGTDPFVSKSGEILTDVYVESIFPFTYFASAGVTGSATAGTGYEVGTGGYSQASTPWIVSQNYNGQVYPLFKLHTISDGDAANTDVKVSITVETSQVSVSSYPKFTVAIRRYDDTDARRVDLESFNCTMDPTANDYVKRVIGDRYKTFNTSVDPPETVFEGEYDNKSKYVYVEMGEGWPEDAKPSGFQAVPAMQAGPVFDLPVKLDHVGLAGTRDSKYFMGFDSTAIGAADRLGFLVSGISAASSNIARGLLVATLTGELSGSGSLTSAYEFADASTGVAGAVSAGTAYNKVAFTGPAYGGWDGIDERLDKLQLMVDGTLSADYYNAIKILGNPDEIDFNLLCVPGIFAGAPATQGQIASKALEMCQSRGDAFYIMDVGNNTISTVTGAVMNSTVDGVVETAKAYDSNYAGVYFPSVKILDVDNNKFVWLPSSVAAFGAFAFNDKVGHPWFAPAGLNRALLNVNEARKRLTSANRDTLYLGKVNPIATFVGQGITIWGQKTLQFRASALDRINVRRLLLTARKLVASVSKYYVFEPNNGQTRSALVNEINPILARIQENQGLEMFKVVIDDTNNTPDVIDRNLLVGDIYLQPTRTAEIFVFTFNITRTGVAFEE